MPADLDQSGNSWHRVRAWLGPSLGWVETQVSPTRTLTVPGTYNVQPGDGVIFVNVVGSVVINLPDVRLWVNETGGQPATGFERALWIKDLGNATAHPIPINAFGTQVIDAYPTVTLINNFVLVRLYPFNDLSGWWRG